MRQRNCFLSTKNKKTGLFARFFKKLCRNGLANYTKLTCNIAGFAH